MNGRQTADDSLSPSPSVAVIIVNYGTAALALDAAASVLAQSLPDHALHLHIVDNASPGDDAKTIAHEITARGWTDRVTLWPEAINHGFGRGNNIVLNALSRLHAPPTYVFLLNPDAALEQGALSRLVTLLDARLDVVGVGAGISKPDGQPVTAAFRFPSLLGEFETTSCFGPISRLLRNHRIPLPPDHPEGPVDWVSGAAVLFRFKALCEVGFFDPGFFLYFEEVDLMRRLRARGGVIWYLPAAHVRHVEGAATGVSSGLKRRKPAYWFQSWSRYHRRAAGRPRAIVAALAHLAGTIINALHGRLRRRPPRLADHYILDFMNHAVLPLLQKGGADHG
jgi:GT2 family glycosyltransferase